MFYAAKSGVKALPKKLLPVTLFAIAVTSLFSVRPAEAFTITLEQMGSNVVGTGSGAFNLTGLMLTAQSITNGTSGIGANQGLIQIGPTSGLLEDGYSGIIGPTSFGSGGLFGAIASGNPFFFNGGRIFVQHGYVSGTALSNSMTFNNQTFASLGLTLGTYQWTWGTGRNQNFTLQIGSVPDGGWTVSLLGCALLGVAVLRRKLRC